MPDQPHTPETTGEPPWLALYRAETERLRVLADLFMSTEVRGETANEIGTIILDVAGRSSVREFMCGPYPTLTQSVNRDIIVG